MRFFPKLARLLNVKFVSDKLERRFHELIIKTMEIRKANGIVRPDMINLLMSLKYENSEELNEQKSKEVKSGQKVESGDTEGKKHNWTDRELIAQCFIFYLAGFDTASTVMSFMCYELALHPDIQKKLAEEIDEIKKMLGGKQITYEVVQKMKYMDMVVSETLRKWPPGVLIDRFCVKDYKYEGEDGLEFTIDKGDAVMLPVYAIHRDPKYYPDPENFDPERFSDVNKDQINAGAYLPFGIGPRNCIGNRFALMEIKAIMYYLLLNFKLEVCKETPIPIDLKKSFFGLFPKKEIQLHIEPRTRK